MSPPVPIPAHRHWQRAFELAERGRGAVSPNPMVGAVLVSGGEVIGEGHHAAYGGLHAERAALADARQRGAETAGSTMFVTLEPCTHTGRQPPCTDALIEAGVASVVVGSDDPSEKAGGGVRALREAGIDVAHAPEEVAVVLRALNQPFRKHAITGRPLIMLKLAMSLDGRVATASGDSKWISGEASRELVHRWRTEVDAVAVGAGTVAADNPKLTARGDPEGGDRSGELRQPARVVFDSRGRLARNSAVFGGASQTPPFLIVSRKASRRTIARLRARGAEVLVAEGRDRRERFVSGIEQLGRAGITSVMVEGGPTLAGVALASGEVDRMEMFVAPLVLGGGRPAFDGAGGGVDAVAEANPAIEVETCRVGQDVLMSSRLKEW